MTAPSSPNPPSDSGPAKSARKRGKEPQVPGKKRLNRITKIARAIKQIGEIQVTDWDFMDLLNTNIEELEISRSLRRLGEIKVMEWDFRSVIPAVKRTANKEVDPIAFFKRTANYKVMEWDFRSALPHDHKPQLPEPGTPPTKSLSRDEMQALIVRLKNFLQYVVVNLIDDPNHAQIKVMEIAPNELRFKLVLVKRDVAMLIGMEGFTAAAIRSILKATAGLSGVQAFLHIHSHEEEIELNAKAMAMNSGKSLGSLQCQRPGNIPAHDNAMGENDEH